MDRGLTQDKDGGKSQEFKGAYQRPNQALQQTGAVFQSFVVAWFSGGPGC